MVPILKTAKCLAVAGLSWLVFCSPVFGGQPGPSAQQVTLGWNPSSDPTVVGYTLYYGTSSGVYPNKIDVSTNTTFTLTGLVPGSTTYMNITSYNAAGMESSYVPEVSYIAPGVLALSQNAASGNTIIQFPVAPGGSYQLQCSPDLITWSNLWVTPTQTNNTWVQFSEPISTAIPSRFYRLILN
jgi:hypothetical protein